jgi:predicted nucleotidyltransferase
MRDGGSEMPRPPSLRNVFVSEADVYSTPRQRPVEKEEREILDKIKRTILRMTRPSKIVLFGSRARDDFRDDSDYDIFVLFPPGEKDEAELRKLNDDITDQLSVLKNEDGEDLVQVFVEEETAPNPDPDADSKGLYAYNLATFPQTVLWTRK